SRRTSLLPQGGDPSGTGRVYSPDGATYISVAEFDEYLSKRARLTAALENTSDAWWQVRLDLQRRIAGLDHDLACQFDLCGVESTIGPVELLLGIRLPAAAGVRGAAAGTRFLVNSAGEAQLVVNGLRVRWHAALR